MSLEKFLLAAAGLAITVLLIFAGSKVLNVTKGTSDAVTQQAVEAQERIENDVILQYENRYIRGSVVTGYIKQIYDRVETINVVFLSKPRFNATAQSQDTLYQRMMTISDTIYVSPEVMFYVTTECNANGIITTVTITEQS